MRIGNVSGVVIESRQRSDTAGHHGHRVCVTAKALKEAAHLLVNHRMSGHAIVEISLLRGRWQFAVKQQIAGFQEVAMFRQLLDRISAVKQYAFVSVDITDLGLAACGGSEAGIVSEHTALAVKLRN